MDRWQQIEWLFHEALQRDRSQRDVFVREACGGDTGLHDEVSSLLANYEEADDTEPWCGNQYAMPTMVRFRACES